MAAFLEITGPHYTASITVEHNERGYIYTAVITEDAAFDTTYTCTAAKQPDSPDAFEALMRRVNRHLDNATQ